MAEGDEENQGSDAEEGGGSSKKKLLIFMIAGFTIVILGALGAFFLLSGGEEKTAETEKSSSPNPGPTNPDDGSPKEAKEGESKADSEKPTEGQPEASAEGEISAKAPEKKEEEVPEDDFGFGKTFKFKTFRMNLGNPLQNHYVHLDISVEYRSLKAEKELASRKAQLRDAVVSIVASKTREFLLNPDGKEELRLQILRRINRYMKNKVEQVFITDILIE